MFKKAMAVSLILVTLLIPVAVYAAAATYSSTLVFDDFDTLPLHSAGGYWYILNWGDFGQVQGYAADSSSVSAGSQGSTTYASLAQHPDATPGSYSNAEIAELLTGAQAGQPGNWAPSQGHPIVFEARVRWSSQYTTTGGTAVGTSGLWLWNSPVGTTGIAPTTSFGFIWAQPGTAFNMGGLNASIIRGERISAPVYSRAVSGIDMTQWNTFKVIWSKGPGPNETLYFYVNGVQVASHAVTTPLGSLSVETWNDNQLSTTSGVFFGKPAATQSMDIDYIRIEKQ